ncbi:SDR family NAD(P)-dependent oxidoreductase [Dictyobacter aurantiacus]|uniref:Beta-ketoacyl-ACP reductase n=1 Tax=Dictyobacter aurantiacus TaxID=1936993 RepID=A0A401ZPE0_9CHLR|nr:SDR family NAD(P)-dependent oxidoreductase [Dictyobacter aurantiacus]GCE08737.1 beta-ketoacyl-ACP reductase [Dictyobacter aurantiacus]
MEQQSNVSLFDLHGKTALITGGALGIGQASARRLAEAGAATMLVDINLEAARATAQDIQARGGRASALYGDVSEVHSIDAIIQTTVETFGSLDILVNNAGIYPFASVLEMTEAAWDQVLAINLKGAFFYAQKAAQQMIKAGRGGRIINISSINGLTPTRFLSHYDASKGGMIALNRTLALELGPHHINVNAIAPGEIITPGTSAASPETLEQAGVTDMNNSDFLQQIPLNRLGMPDDIARVVLFLASEAASYMAGSLLTVDGGYLLT